MVSCMLSLSGLQTLRTQKPPKGGAPAPLHSRLLPRVEQQQPAHMMRLPLGMLQEQLWRLQLLTWHAAMMALGVRWM